MYDGLVGGTCQCLPGTNSRIIQHPGPKEHLKHCQVGFSRAKLVLTSVDQLDTVVKLTITRILHILNKDTNLIVIENALDDLCAVLSKVGPSALADERVYAVLCEYVT